MSDWDEVTQTILATDEKGPDAVYGNCWQAAIASMLKLPLDAVPHFGQFTWPDPALELWLRGRGLTYRHEMTSVIPDRLCLVNGHSPRGYLHSTVGFGGEVVWDPHPSHAGLLDVTEVEWFEKWPDAENACWACGIDRAEISSLRAELTTTRQRLEQLAIEEESSTAEALVVYAQKRELESELATTRQERDTLWPPKCSTCGNVPAAARTDLDGVRWNCTTCCEPRFQLMISYDVGEIERLKGAE